MSKGSIQNALATTQESYLSFEPEHEVDEWQDPIPLEVISVPEIPANILPGWLGDFADGVSKETQTPPALSVMLALSVVATCVQRLAIVSPYKDGSYTEPLNIWTATILPPASRKTAVFKPFTNPLTEWEEEQSAEANPKIHEFNAHRVVNEKRLESLKNDAAKLSDIDERNTLIAEITELNQKIAEPSPVAPRLWTGDVTPEKLQNMLAEHGERMSVLSDEGGIFSIMTGLYSNGQANMDVFLQAHAGKAVRVDRGTRTVTLKEPTLSFGLAIQPAIIADIGTAKKSILRGNGTLARFLYAYPYSNIGARDIRFRCPVAEETKLRYETYIQSLLRKRSAITEPIVCHLSAPALEKWIQFAEAIEKRQGSNGDLESIQDWSGKLPGACLRIAGLMHIVDRDFDQPHEISPEIIERSVTLSNLLIDHAKAVLNTCGSDENIEDAKYVSAWIKQAGQTLVKQRDLQRLPRFRNGKKQRLLSALSILLDRHIIGKQQKFGKTKPSYVYPVNPSYLSHQGEYAHYGTRDFSS